ncbi:unnamed protein product, partial [Polarella glacialis]
AVELVCGTAPGSQPQGHGPQSLWPTPAALVVDPPRISPRWQALLLSHVQRLTSGQGSDGSWLSNGHRFLEDCTAAGGTAAAAGARLRAHIEEAARERGTSEEPWQTGRRSLLTGYRSEFLKAGLLSPKALQHLASSRFHMYTLGPLWPAPSTWTAARALGNQSTCGIFLEDPRTPAAVADMPESLRLRLGWGEAQTFQLPRGSLLLYPGWLQHAPSPRWSSSEMGEGEASARRQRVAVSFTIAVQLRDGSVGSSRATGASAVPRPDEKSPRDLDLDEL